MNNTTLRPEGGAPQDRAKLLEKMQWLADKGFEPDRWTTEHNGINLWSDTRSNEMITDQPYFTESRLWRLLPDEIENSGETWTKKIEDQFCGYWCSDWTEGNGAYLEAIVYEYLIDGLLDLTIWAVRNEYLVAKAEVKG